MPILDPLQVLLILCEMSDEEAGRILEKYPEPGPNVSDEEHQRWGENVSAELIGWRAARKGGGVG